MLAKYFDMTVWLCTNFVTCFVLLCGNVELMTGSLYPDIPNSRHSENVREKNKSGGWVRLNAPVI